MILSSNGQPTKVFFKYERLQDFCYHCGHLGHNASECSNNSDDKDINEAIQDNYGPWLRASPMKKQPSAGKGQQATGLRKQMVFQPDDTERATTSNGSVTAADDGAKGGEQRSNPAPNLAPPDDHDADKDSTYTTTVQVDATRLMELSSLD